ncbi:CsgG/HfaB family protein [Croceicoccus sp. F390]|uniref:CsgG/HfaB family protein n=1 Tax=Croceicoccus esteveae TaxID=3075597 RepID=A0ABU2ZL83_9SPHN|nr:CsgG/HfaB family protein [Croceicoccus sp. F390]MDT0576981.1 CsgG/HfaB family protein [Croceicoccus sp. F390]
MRRTIAMALASTLALVSLPQLAAAQGRSSARQQQDRGQAEIPRCQRNLGTVAIIEPDNKWWREFQLGSPEAILKIFVQKSGCFSLVNRGRSLDNRALERALAENGELQAGSNVGGGQVRTADYFLQPDIVSSNNNSGGGGIGGMLGGLVGGTVGRLASGLNVRKKEANVTLSAVNARTTVEEALTEGYARKQDLSFGGSGFAGGLFSGYGGAEVSGYQNTDIGQVIVLAYLDAYIRLVNDLGGLPTNASAAALQATTP